MKIALIAMSLVVSVAAIFAVDRAVRYYDLSTDVEAKAEMLATAATSAQRLRTLSGDRNVANTDQLKKVVHACSAKNAVPLLYVTEFDREAGENAREQSVLCRAANVPQAKLVGFLADTENQASNAKVKELKLKQSPDRADQYQDVEVVFAVRIAK